jgi:hypothetical protein
MREGTEPLQREVSSKPFEIRETMEGPHSLASRQTIPGNCNRLPSQVAFLASVAPQRSEVDFDGGVAKNDSQGPGHLAISLTHHLDAYLGSTSTAESSRMSRSSGSSAQDIKWKPRCVESLQCGEGQLSEWQQQQGESWGLAQDMASEGGTFGLDPPMGTVNLDSGVDRLGKGWTMSIHDDQHQFDGFAQMLASDDDYKRLGNRDVMSTDTSHLDAERTSQRALYEYKDSIDCQPCFDHLAKTNTYAPRSNLSFDRMQDDAKTQTSPNGAMAMSAVHSGEVLPEIAMHALSIGTIGYASGCSITCKFFGSNRGCKEGVTCDRCHLCRWRRTCSRKPSQLETSSLTHGEYNACAVR